MAFTGRIDVRDADQVRFDDRGRRRRTCRNHAGEFGCRFSPQLVCHLRPPSAVAPQARSLRRAGVVGERYEGGPPRRHRQQLGMKSGEDSNSTFLGRHVSGLAPPSWASRSRRLGSSRGPCVTAASGDRFAVRPLPIDGRGTSELMFDPSSRKFYSAVLLGAAPFAIMFGWFLWQAGTGPELVFGGIIFDL